MSFNSSGLLTAIIRGNDLLVPLSILSHCPLEEEQEPVGVNEERCSDGVGLRMEVLSGEDEGVRSSRFGIELVEEKKRTKTREEEMVSFDSRFSNFF